MMFAVLGYQVENDDTLAALKTARKHLDPGGLLIFDIWHGPAVLSQRPSERINVIPGDSREIVRAASGQLDTGRHICSVRFRVWQFTHDRLTARTDETHLMRYFFPLELTLFLECSGFSLVRLGAFPAFDKEPDDTTWSVVAVARAV